MPTRKKPPAAPVAVAEPKKQPQPPADVEDIQIDDGEALINVYGRYGRDDLIRLVKRVGRAQQEVS